MKENLGAWLDDMCITWSSRPRLEQFTSRIHDLKDLEASHAKLIHDHDESIYQNVGELGSSLGGKRNLRYVFEVKLCRGNDLHYTISFSFNLVSWIS